MEAIADMEAYLFDIKETLKEQDYIVLMDKLQAIANNNPRVEDKKHRVKYSIKTKICFIDDNDEYKDIKKDIYYVAITLRISLSQSIVQVHLMY